MSWEAVRTYHKAEVKMNEGNIKKGKKELFHSLRYLMFALQIIRTVRKVSLILLLSLFELLTIKREE